MTTMTLNKAISSVQVRNEMRGKSGEYPNGEGWGHCWREDGYWIPKDAWKVIDAHLAKGAQVPDERVYAPLPSDADEYDRGHVDGWNACRQAMLSQRGES